VTARRIIAIALFLLPASAGAATVTVGGYTFLEQANDSLYRDERVGGDVSSRYDIAVLGDGFTLTEQGVFNDAVFTFFNQLFTIPPYDRHKCSFNVWVVNLVSNDSGIDEGTTLRDTPLDCIRAVPGEPESYITGDFDKCREVCDLARVPARDAIYVIVNSTENGAYAYAANAITFTTRRPSGGWFLAHELGHLIALLDDEYRCRVCDGTDDGRHYVGPEPGAPNLTIETDPTLVKWKDLLSYPTDPVPTLPDFSCDCDDIGIWEGGGYHAFDIYRPAEYCLMDGVMCPGNDAFCKVCFKAIAKELKWCPFSIIDSLTVFPAMAMEAHLRNMETLIWFGGMALVREMPFCVPCQVAPEARLAEVLVKIPDPAAGSLSIIDDLGNKVATGEVAGGDLRASFKLNPARMYYAHIDPGRPTADRLTIRASMTIDGRAVDLGPGTEVTAP